MKTIMLCLNQLGIGGIETAALNQTIQLIKRGYRVIILARDGIYREKFEQEGAILIDFEFEVQNKYNLEKIEKIMRIIEEYAVEQVHIHQFYCMSTVFPACMQKGIPYVVYLHNGVKGAYDWFEKCFSCYKIMFKLFFSNAERIIAIKETTRKENEERYQIDPNKYKIINNSIDFDKFKIEGSREPETVEKFLIIGRLAEEKEKSIKNAIQLFKQYYKENRKARLTIVGDGQLKEKIKKEIEDIREVTNMLGERNDIAKIISENDIVIALGRCILEAIAMKRLALISGYEQLNEIIVPSNMKQAIEKNFNGEGLKEYNAEELTRKIRGLDANTIKSIVEQNYQYAYENLNASKNIYIIEEPEKIKTEMDTESTMKSIIELENMYVSHVEYTDKLYKECKKTEEWYKEQMIKKEKELEQLKQEKENLEEVYSSRIWKIRAKVKGFLKRE